MEGKAKAGGGSSSTAHRANSPSSACGGGNEGPGPSKRAKKSRICIIHCTDDKSELVSIRDLHSWRSLLQAAEIRQHKALLEVAKDLPDNEVPDIAYHRKCRSAFTHKRALTEIANEKEGEHRAESEVEMNPRVFHRRSSSISETSSRVYEPVCIFCEKSKYLKGHNTREPLTQCVELRCDDAIRQAAMQKEDSKILAVVARDLVAAEARYHRSCYREYTRTAETKVSSKCKISVSKTDAEYMQTESNAFTKLFQYIREDLFERPRVLKLKELTGMIVTWMRETGVENVRETTKKHIRRKLATEFGDSIHFVPDDSGKQLVYPDNLTLHDLVKENVQLKDALKKKFDSGDILQKAALQLRTSVQEHDMTSTWPPLPSDLCSRSSYIPEELRSFLQCLLSGQQKSPLSPRVLRLIESIAQDLVYGITCAKVTPPKHILLPYAVKALTGNVELVKIINRLGHGISYTKVEEVDTALCLHKLASQREDTIALPENIQPNISTTLAWDNIDRLEETLSGGGTSHRVNGIIIQQAMIGPKLPSNRYEIPKQKQRVLEIDNAPLPVYNTGERVGPPSRSYITVDAKDAEEEAYKKNLLWIVARLHSSENQFVSGWTGFNISVRDEMEVMKDVVEYLPTINAPATEMSTIQEVLVQSKRIMAALNLQSIVLVADQAIYAKVTEILWKHPERFPNIIPRLGVFHTVCTMLSIIGKRFQDAGLKDLCIESGVLAEGSVTGVLEGRKYNRAVRFHKLLYEALLRLLWKEFLNWMEVNHADQNHHIEVLATDVSEIIQDPCQETSAKLLQNKSFLTLTERFKEYQEYLQHQRGNSLTIFWMSYLQMVDNMLNLLRASREGNWKLHLSAIHNFIPWCFAYDNVNYARYLSSYYAEMTNLHQEHPEVQAHLQSGGFSVQLGSTNPFGRIPVDQCLETTINRDTQTQGGTKGFSLKPSALNRYYLTAEYRSAYLRILREALDLHEVDLKHHDLQKTRMQRDEMDVKSLVDTLDSTWINPFHDGLQELVSISTGRVATEEIAHDLLKANEIGLKAYQLFREERLEGSGKKFHDPIKKQKLKTFSNLTKKDKSFKGGPKEIILKADRNLFAHMVIIAQSRNLEMKDVLCHSLGPIPWSLATTDGCPRKTSKAALATELQKAIPPAENVPKDAVCLIDGMAIVQKLKGSHKTFADVAHALLSIILNEGAESSRIDVVFDVYQEQSIKNVERSRRGASEGTEFKNISPGHSVQQWRKFLACPSNKTSLIKVVVQEWQQQKNRERLADKVLYVTLQEKCYKISRTGSEEVDELQSTHEEADTRLLLHALHASLAGHKSLIIVSDDTDVLVLCLAFSAEIQSQIYQKSGTQARTKYIDITKLAQVLGPDNCRALIGLHAFTGCDSVSSFAGRGKVSGLKLIKLNPEFKSTFQEIGTQWSLTTEQHRQLEAFVCHLYQSKTETTNVNDLRYRLFCAKKGEVESWQLPPCASALKKHSQRANYQAAVWRHSLENCPLIPSPVGKGWATEKENDTEELVVDWCDAPPAPEAVLQLLSCTCSRICKLPGCPCLANGLNCTYLCKLQTCTNQVPEESEEMYADVNDESDDDEWD